MRPRLAALIIRFKLPGRVVTLWEAAWRAVSHLMGKYAGLDDVMEYLLDAYLQENVRDALASIRTHRLLDRRGWRCANPTCSRRDNLHGHHVKFRSHGGGDEETNIAYLCRSCHLRGVHEGWITVSGIAPDGLVWALGTSLNDVPHMVVDGRNVVAGACMARPWKNLLSVHLNGFLELPGLGVVKFDVGLSHSSAEVHDTILSVVAWRRTLWVSPPTPYRPAVQNHAFRTTRRESVYHGQRG